MNKKTRISCYVAVAMLTFGGAAHAQEAATPALPAPEESADAPASAKPADALTKSAQASPKGEGKANVDGRESPPPAPATDPPPASALAGSSQAPTERPTEPAPTEIAPTKAAAAPPVDLPRDLAPKAEPARPAPPRRHGVNVEMAMGTAYNRRGLNAFQSVSQHDAAGFVSPRIRWDILETGFHARYESYYQAWGKNRDYLVDIGRGHEQVFAGGFGTPFGARSRFEAELRYIFFPFALRLLTQTRNPSYLEPSATLAHKTHTGFDLRFEIAFYGALQKLLADERYVYFHPSVYRRFDLTQTFAFEGGLSIGYKMFTSDVHRLNNAFDLDFFLGLPIHLTPQLYVAPTVHLTWCLLASAYAGKQYFVWGGLDFGIEL